MAAPAGRRPDVVSGSWRRASGLRSFDTQVVHGLLLVDGLAPGFLFLLEFFDPFKILEVGLAEHLL